MHQYWNKQHYISSCDHNPSHSDCNHFISWATALFISWMIRRTGIQCWLTASHLHSKAVVNTAINSKTMTKWKFQPVNNHYITIQSTALNKKFRVHRLDKGAWENLSASHAVEEVLLRPQSSQKSTGDKPSSLRRWIVWQVRWQWRAIQHQRWTTAFQTDLTQSTRNLDAVYLHTVQFNVM